MKYITLIALMLVTIAGSGQDLTKKKDSTETFMLGSYSRETFIGSCSHGLTFNSAVKSDTTRCVMLVCDTSKSIITSFSLAIYGSDDLVNPVGVYWQRGYAVTEYGVYGIYHRRFYLDYNKQPLRKSIVVWMTQ